MLFVWQTLFTGMRRGAINSLAKQVLHKPNAGDHSRQHSLEKKTNTSKIVSILQKWKSGYLERDFIYRQTGLKSYWRSILGTVLVTIALAVVKTCLSN